MIHAEEKNANTQSQPPPQKKNGLQDSTEGSFLVRNSIWGPLRPTNTLVETHSPRVKTNPAYIVSMKIFHLGNPSRWWNVRLRGPFYVLMSSNIFMGVENGFPNHGLREEGRYIRVPTPTPSKSDHQDYYVTTCFVRKSYKPSFVTLTGKGSVPRKEMASDVSACMKRSKGVTESHPTRFTVASCK